MLKELAKNIFKLEVPFYNIYTSVFFIKQGDKAIIIDAADKSSDAENYIIPALEKIGIKSEDVTAILLTHSHGDHTGGLSLLSAECKNAKIYGFSKPAVPFDEERFFLVSDGDVIEENIKVLLLEGHDKLNGGYLYLPQKTLISGDSLQLYGLNAYGLLVRYPKLYLESILKLKKAKINHIFASHKFVPLGSDAIGKRASKRYIKCAKKCLMDMIDFVEEKGKIGITDTKELQSLFIKERGKTYKNFPTANFEIIIDAVKNEYK